MNFWQMLLACSLLLWNLTIAGCTRRNSGNVVQPAQVYQPTAAEQRNQREFDSLRSQRD